MYINIYILLQREIYVYRHVDRQIDRQIDNQIIMCIYIHISKTVLTLLIIISYVIVLVQVLSNKRKSKIKPESQQACMICAVVRSTWDHCFQKTFPKLDFLKLMSVTMIAHTEYMKMKNPITPTLSVFSLSPFLLVSYLLTF